MRRVIEVYRTREMAAELRPAEDGALTATLATDALVEVGGRRERLSLRLGAVDTSRFEPSGPLLLFHDPTRPIGGVGNVRVEGAGPARLKGDLKIADTPLGRDARALIEAGGMRGVSIGYAIDEEREERDGSVLVTRSRLLEASLLAIPADAEAAIGRGAGCTMQTRGRRLAALLAELIAGRADDGDDAEIVAAMAAAAGIEPGTVRQILDASINCPPLNRLAGFAEALDVDVERLINAAEEDGCTYSTDSRSCAMPDSKTAAPADTGATATRTRAGATPDLEAERARAADIQRTAAQFGVDPDTAGRAVREGWAVDRFRGHVLEHLAERDDAIGNTRAGGPVHISERGDDWSRAAGRFSLRRLVLSQIPGRDSPDAGLERELSREVSRREGRRGGDGFAVPNEVWARAGGAPRQRALTTVSTTPADGAALVETELLAESFIEALMPRMVIGELGPTVLGGLTGDVTIPRLSTRTSSAWLADEGDTPAESSPAMDLVPLSPRHHAATARYSRRTLVQSTPAIEALLRQDMLRVTAEAFERAVLAGTGTGAEPTGLINRTDVTEQVIAGTAPTWAEIAAMQQTLDAADATANSRAWVSSNAWRAIAQTTKLDAGSGRFILADDGTIAGDPARFTSIVPSDLGAGNDETAIIYGEWSHLYLANWGAAEIIVDPFTESAAGNVRVSVHSFVDYDLGHPESFTILTGVK